MAETFLCPQCDAPLQRQENPRGVLWACPACGGRGVGVALLRGDITRAYLNRLWIAARGKEGIPGRRCPACGQPMVQVAPPADAEALALDVCTLDQFVWFDAQEYERLPRVPPPRELPAEARELVARLEREKVRLKRREQQTRRVGEALTQPVSDPASMLPFLPLSPASPWLMILDIIADLIRSFQDEPDAELSR